VDIEPIIEFIHDNKMYGEVTDFIIKKYGVDYDMAIKILDLMVDKFYLAIVGGRVFVL